MPSGSGAGNGPTIVWFRDDLRLADNAALRAAVDGDRPVLPIYVLDEESSGIRPLGAARRWWLHHSLTELMERLRHAGAPLVLRRGKSLDVLAALARETGAAAVHWNRRYHPAERAVDDAVEAELGRHGVTVGTHDGVLLHDPEHLRTTTDKPYKVYTPFWRAIEGGDEPREPLPAVQRIAGIAKQPASDHLGDWTLLPTKPDWSGPIAEAWEPGERAAQRALSDFLDDGLAHYNGDRDLPGKDGGTSRLSPHLAFGELTPYQVWHATRGRHVGRDDLVTFRKEVVWREFSKHLLFNFPKMPSENFNDRFDDFGWKRDAKALQAWRRGRTGYPIVDAGMRQLWQTGWMHNRVRLVVASFLTKHLLIDWRAGEGWFWDTLVDADLASNVANWQWVAGSGADAAPYFRIFNPVLQGEKFDPKGAYVRAFVPEIAGLPDAVIHRPWEASADVLAKAGVTLGKTYPEPIVDHKAARQRALSAYDKIKDAA